jgi:hypothetical protein
MATMIATAELQDRGVTVRWDEAIAIAQQLMVALGGNDCPGGESPDGPPTRDSVFLMSDGAVTRRSCTAAPTVGEVAAFLQSLLDEDPRVPGAVRYVIARALLTVDVPPFGSLDDFSRSLARYERLERGAAVRGLLRRAGLVPAALATVVAPAIVPVAQTRVSSSGERRHSPILVSEIRQQLRQADLALYQQRAAAAATPIPSRPAWRATLAAVACLALGVALIGVVESARASHAETPGVAAAAAHDVWLPSEQLAPTTSLGMTEPVRLAVKTRPSRSPRAMRAGQVRAAGRSSSPPLLARLRLTWLRNVFTHHAERS